MILRHSQLYVLNQAFGMGSQHAVKGAHGNGKNCNQSTQVLNEKLLTNQMTFENHDNLVV